MEITKQIQVLPDRKIGFMMINYMKLYHGIIIAAFERIC